MYAKKDLSWLLGALALAGCGPTVVNCPSGHYRDANGACVEAPVDGDDDDAPGDDDDDPSADADADGYSLAEGDCDDANPAIHPDAEEQAGNRKDDDCDRSIDEEELDLEDVLVDAGTIPSSCVDPVEASEHAPFSPPKFVAVTVVRVGNSSADDLPALAPVEAAIAAASDVLADAGLTLFLARSEVVYESRYHTLAKPVLAELRAEYPVDGTLYVFVVDEVLNAAKEPLEGLAVRPGGEGLPAVAVAQGALGDDSTALLHLVGHAFGLDDTHTGTLDGSDPERVDGSNCGGAGDAVCDTPADPGPSWANPDGCGVDPYACALTGCGLDGGGDLFRPWVGNVMSAYPDVCFDGAFTDDQLRRMVCTLERDLPGLSLTDAPVLAPVLEVGSVEVDDDVPGLSEGDGDGLFEAGEIVEITVEIANRGAEPALGVTAILSTTEPQASVTTSTAAVGGLDVGASDTATFVVSVPLSCSSDLVLPLSVRMSDSAGGEWTDTFTVPVDCTGIADVRAVSADHSGNLRPGVLSDFEVEVRNNSSAALGGLEVDLYLSADATIDPASDTFVCRDTLPGQIAAGTTKAFTVSCTVPNLPAGSRTFGFVLDPDDDLQESDEGNNIAVDSSPSPVVLPANLEVSAVTATPNPVAKGGDLTVGYTRSNTGAGDAGAFGLSLRLSTNATVNANDTLLCRVTVSGGMVAGDSRPASVTCPLPASVGPGTWYVGVTIDEDGDIAESDETDNTAVAPVTLSVQADVDLWAKQFDLVDAAAFPGGSFDATVRVENLGADDAEDYYISFLFSTDGTVTTADVEACRLVQPRDLAGGAVETLTISCPVPPLPMGTYTVGAYVDSTSALAETDEGNNLLAAATPFTIQGVDLTVRDVVAQTHSGAPGSPVDVVYVRSNLGNASSGAFRLSIRWSSDTQVDTNDPQGCAVDITDSPAFEERNPVLACTVPNGLAPGNYTVGVIMDSQSVVSETNESNNVAFDPTRFTVP